MTISVFRLAPLCRLPSEHAKDGVAIGSRVNNTDEEKTNTDSDSEDEEVAVTCFGALRIDEFDSSDDDDDDEEDDDEGDGSDAAGDERFESARAEREGVVRFISKRHLSSDSLLVKPTPTTATGLSPFGDMTKGENFGFKTESLECCEKKHVASFSHLAKGGSTDEEEMREDVEDRNEDESVVSSSSSVECDENDVVSRVVSECTDGNRSDTLGVDNFALEESEDDDDLTGFLEDFSQSSGSVTQDEMDTSERIIGVMGDREDLLTIPKVKRMLSFNTLAELSEEAKPTVCSQKRRKLTSPPSSLFAKFTYPRPTISSDEEDDTCSALKDESLDNKNDELDDRCNIPVALLTPPSTPFTLSFDGDGMTTCEWPSNLVVDSAMTAAYELTPMSLASLEELELRDAGCAGLAC